MRVSYIRIFVFDNITLIARTDREALVEDTKSDGVKRNDERGGYTSLEIHSVSIITSR